MNIDSCQFSLNSDLIRPNYNKFLRKKEYSPETNIESTYYEASNVIAGLNNIKYFPNDNVVVVSLSGKILPTEHKQLINNNNIDQVVSIINDTKLLQLDISELMLDSKVRKLDMTENIQVSNVNEYISAFNCINSRNYIKTAYQGRGEDKGKTGIVFRRPYKTFKEYLILYDKEKETKNSVYNGILRAESKRCTFDSIRRDVKGGNNLNDILTSKERPLYNLAKKIIGVNETNTEFINMANKVNGLNELYIEALLQQTNFDLPATIEVLKEANRQGNRMTLSRHIKDIEMYLLRRNSNGDAELKLNEILLKLAV